MITPSRREVFIITLISIAICLSFYLYLNIEVIDEVHTDSSRYKPLSRRKPMLDHESIFSDSGPSMIKLSDLLAHCIVALRIAGKEVVNLSLLNNANLSHVGSKGKTRQGVDDVVTGADMKSHHMIINTIKDSYRRLKVVSEEDTTDDFANPTADDDILPIDRVQFAKLLRSDLHEIEAEHADRGSLIDQQETLVWIDPLDATKEYSENLTDYVTLMACVVHKSVPIAGVIYKPFTNETFWSMWDPSHKEESHYSPDLRRVITHKHRNRISDNISVIVSRSHAGQVKDVLSNVYDNRVSIISAGGSGYKTIEVISRNVDAYVHMTYIKKWDICAPNAILSSISNGNLTTLSGDRITFGNPNEKVVIDGLIATLSPKNHRQLVDLRMNLLPLSKS